MLEHIPQFQALSRKEQRKIMLRLQQHAPLKHPERGRAIAREVEKIEAELRKLPEPAKA
jgi:hypothetical protein